MLYLRDVELENFDAEERLKQVERSVDGEVKVVGERKVRQRGSKMIS